MTQNQTTRPSPWLLSADTDGVQCVAVQYRGDEVAVRSTNRPEQGELTFTASEFAAFTSGVKAGDFDRMSA